MTHASKKYFGTDGIRGEVGNSLIDPSFVLKLGWAVGKVLVRDGGRAKVIIGKDTRISGYMLESALEAGLSAAGADILLLGPMPTPGIAYLTRTLRASAGIVISASHNPYHDNGVKFFYANGLKLSDELEALIEQQLELPMTTVKSADLGKAQRLKDAAGRYIEFCKSTFPSQLTLNGLKIVVDCANGATYNIAPSVFHELGAEVIPLAVSPDGFNINHQSGAVQPEFLQKAVLAHQADLGIALDGDGDRVIMVDHQGEVVDGDEILCILAKTRLDQMGERFGVVGTVMSNLGLEQALREFGIDFVRAQVGDRHVMETLQQHAWSLGGESSGHIVNLDLTTTGDGIITALQVLSSMQFAGRDLHSLKKIMTKRPQVLINVPIKSRVNLGEYPQIQQEVAATEKKLARRGRVLLRSSGTEPLIRVMVEADEEILARQSAQALAEIVAKFL
ncbi:MAG TPA: phosphoglucosamine mutase [Coxiellaceae bacterium]|nr:phosphoglucosamine mutase [Coxiellaceae bacterium]